MLEDLRLHFRGQDNCLGESFERTWSRIRAWFVSNHACDGSIPFDISSFSDEEYGLEANSIDILLDRYQERDTTMNPRQSIFRYVINSNDQVQGFSLKKRNGRKPARKHLLSVICDNLETRIVPAVLVDARHLVYTDVDGDDVSVVTSKPIFTSENVNQAFQFDIGSVDGSKSIRQQLQSINLDSLGSKAEGLSLAVSVVGGSNPGSYAYSPGSHFTGDGFANVGSIDATGIDLGTVRIAGDLGRIQAGSGVADVMPGFCGGHGVCQLYVNSLGAAGVATQATGGDLESVIKGSVGRIMVAKDVENASVSILASRDSKVPVELGTLRIGGSLIGGAADDSGSIHVQGYLNQFRIKGSIQGSSGVNSGSIMSLGTYRFLPFGITGYVGGDVIGGRGEGSGQISMKGSYGGGIQSVGACANEIKVGGSLRGGISDGSGGIVVDGIVRSIEIGGDMINSGVNNLNGYIQVGYAGKIKVGGSILSDAGGMVGDGAKVTQSAVEQWNGSALIAKYGLGNIDIRGSVTGSASQPVSILAGAAHAAFQDLLSIGRLRIGKDVRNLNIVAGAALPGEVPNADARIGRIFVGGNWAASNIYAGVSESTHPNAGLLDSPTKYSAVAGVRIGGEVLNPDPATLSGIHAEEIGTVLIGTGGNGGAGGVGGTGGNGGAGSVLHFYGGNGGNGGAAGFLARKSFFDSVFGVGGNGGNGGMGGSLLARRNWFDHVIGLAGNGGAGGAGFAGAGGNGGVGFVRGQAGPRNDKLVLGNLQIDEMPSPPPPSGN